MVKKALYIIAATMLLTACDKLDIGGMFHPASTDVKSRVAESFAYNNWRGEPILTVQNDNYSFYACADVHAEGYPKRLAEMVRREQADSTARFFMVLGDLAADSTAWPHYAKLMLFDSTPQPDTAFAIVGNHDLFFNNWYNYRALFHTSTYCFHVYTPNYHDLFVMLDSGSGTLSDSQLNWLRETLRSNMGACRHIVVCMHHNLFKTDHSQTISGNLTLEETFTIMGILSDYGVDMLLQGHDHFRDVVRFNNVDYITLDDLKDYTPHASYLMVDMGTTIGYSFVPMGDYQ